MNILVNLMGVLLSLGAVLLIHFGLAYGMQRLLTEPVNSIENAYDVRVRRAWLRAFSYIINIFILLLCVNLYFVCRMGGSSEAIGQLVAYFIFGFIFLKLTYSCAYCDRGPKFLLFIIIVFALNGMVAAPQLVLLIVFTVYQVMCDLPVASLSRIIGVSLLAICTCLAVFCFVYYWVNSIRLFRANRVYRKNKAQAAAADNNKVEDREATA